MFFGGVAKGPFAYPVAKPPKNTGQRHNTSFPDNLSRNNLLFVVTVDAARTGCSFALIKKEDFDDKIEPIKYELPPEETTEEEIIVPDNSNLNLSEAIILPKQYYEKQTTGFRDLRDKTIETGKPIITASQKKKFSSRNVGDDYI